MTRRLAIAAGVMVAMVLTAGQSRTPQAPAAPALVQSLDRVATRWVDETLKKMTIDDKVGQVVMSSINSLYLASDSEAFTELIDKVQTLKLGGFVVFGGSERAPNVLLNNAYGTADAACNRFSVDAAASGWPRITVP